MKRPFILLVFLILNTLVQAQNQGNVWYFGENAGLDFNGGSPVALTDGSMNTDEGCASISDNSGNVLFYSDGCTVWNKNHTIMPNGTGLLGSFSSTQSCIFVLQPGSNSIFYIFTVAQVGGTDGLRYSIVDLTLDGGLGDITTKNALLLSPVCEKISAVKRSGSNDVWILTHEWNSNAFYAYILSSTGINLTPVVSYTGSSNTGGTGCGNINCNAVGAMKISSKGNRSALAMRNTGIELFDFNDLSGIVSNPVIFPNTWNPVYGIEFSPNGNILYVTKISSGANIYQFNLLAGSTTAIINSATLVGTSSSPAIGSLQLGPDNKIYVATRFSGYVGVINNPDVLGIGCNYNDQGVYLNGKLCRMGLPSYNQTYWQFTTEEEKINSNPFSIFPNPANESIFIELPSENEELLNLKVFNIIGEKVFETTFKKNITLNIQLLNKGTYIVAIENTKTKKQFYRRFGRI